MRRWINRHRETGRWGTCESDLKRRMIKSKDGNTQRQRRVSLHPPFDVALLLLLNTFSAWRDVLSSLVSKPSPAISLYYALHARRCWFDLEITRVHGFCRSARSSNISQSWILNHLKLSDVYWLGNWNLIGIIVRTAVGTSGGSDAVKLGLPIRATCHLEESFQEWLN